MEGADAIWRTSQNFTLPWWNPDLGINPSHLLRWVGILMNLGTTWRHKRALHAPVSIEYLLTLLSALTLSISFHAAVWAVALVTFFGCHRLGEITVSSASSFDPSLHVLHSADVSFVTLRDGSRSASFRIPWTKTTREEGASVILTARDDQLCPCAALKNHLDVNCDAPRTSSLFTYVTADGRWEHMTKYRFMDFCTKIWSKASLTHVLGHSFRIGGAVKLLLAGVSPEIVVATGDWTSLGDGWRRSFLWAHRVLITGLTLMLLRRFSKSFVLVIVSLRISLPFMTLLMIFSFVFVVIAFSRLLFLPCIDM